MLRCIRMGNYNSVDANNDSNYQHGPFNEHFYGLVNFGNTCYVNSVLQALYFCRPFREKIIQYKLQQQKSNKNNKENLLNCLAELFYLIVTMKKKKGIVHPKKFIARLRKDNESFDNLFQQDAHEFLNYLINTCADILKEEMKEEYQLLNNNLSILNNNNKIESPKPDKKKDKYKNGNINHNQSNNSTSQTLTPNSSTSTINSLKSKLSKSNQINILSNESIENLTSNENKNSTDETWIHELFQGILVNETRCLNCDTSSSKEENFLDLSVDVDQNTSLSHCLQEFSNMEMLCGECKYYCDKCSSKQEAEKRMRIKKLPRILALHLKRFKFMSDLNRFKKLTYRVVFPFELRLFNTTEDCVNGDRIYDLVSFVVHCGVGLNRGHYISVVKSGDEWFLFDDEQVEKIEVSNFEDFYGLAQDKNKKSETSYILFYESRES